MHYRESPLAVVVGGANFDVSGRANTALLQGDSNPGKVTFAPGGVGRNIAENLARLGNRCQLITVFGGDACAQLLKQSCLNAGVGIDHSLTFEGASSPSYLSIHHGDGEMEMAVNDMALLDQLDASQLSRQYALLQQAQLLVIDANLSASALAFLFERFAHKPILVDPVSSHKADRLKPYLEQIDTLKPNLNEAEQLAAQRLSESADVQILADAVHMQGVNRVLISLGRDGAYASEAGQGRFLAAGKADVANVTGAGDALMAGLAHGRLRQWSWLRSVEFALAAARLALMTASTINPAMSVTMVHRLLRVAEYD